ncbi:hypothetical protein [uncultured Rikenella sp.]|uniref:hypothetical protein n=1 Tax=uncultured Rikenella sp. TaxID=368003 RepID=UPI00272C78E5|nr:hypothetical protein [uncultured Rikenella sp.]
MSIGLAPGFRDAGDYGIWGDPMLVGNHGSNWSVNAMTTSGIFLNFFALHLNSNGTTHRATGLQLRCLSE